MFLKHVFCLVIIITMLCSCKIRQRQAESKIAEPPAAYHDRRQDSLNAAQVSWKQYFQDSLLTQLIGEGLANNPDIHIAFQKIEAAGAGMLYARGRLFPQASVNAAYLQRKFGLYTMDGAGNISTYITPGRIVPINLPDYYTGFQASWEADIWGRLRNKRRAALARYLSSIEGRNLVISNMVAQIAHAYYTLVVLDNELDVIRETIRIQSKAVELVTFQKQAGVVNELAVKQFRSQLLNSQTMEFEILQEITAHENKLNMLLGRYSGTIARNKALVNDSVVFNARTGVPGDLLKFRPDVKRAEFELKAAHADLGAARAAFYPTLNFAGAAGLQAFQTTLLFQLPQSLAYMLLGNLTAPLLNRSSIKAAFRNAGAAQAEAFSNYQKNVLNAYMEVNNQVTAIRNLEKIVALKATQVEENSQSWEILSELFKTNRANYVEVLMAQRTALEAKLQLLDAKHRQFDAFIDLYKALGGGWQ